ncbi:MAG: ADP-ribosylglycohydrolase family protein [Planctomycetaceae bacterium]
MAESQIIGCILGTAVGDALGLPYENVSRDRLPGLLGPPDRYRLLPGCGMVSDDTEHTCMIAQSLIASGGCVDEFSRQFAKRMRWWFLAFPAGIGRATFRAGIRLWLGCSPTKSGVYSAGNGPAMRSAVFGAAVDDMDRIVEYCRISTRLTHLDPRAEFGAIAVAVAARCARQSAPVEPADFTSRVSSVIGTADVEFTRLLTGVAASVQAGESTADFAMQAGLGTGISGYIYDTVPVALHAWLGNQRDFRTAVTSVIECGGDTDTTAAIVGGIIGTGTGEDGIPPEWIQRLREWPRSVNWMRRLAGQLALWQIDQVSRQPLRLNPVALVFRNLFFLMVVLLHGFRRLLPPY